MHRALDGGVNFYDCCWEYHRGKSEEWMGKGLKGLRDKVFIMTKVCTHGRDASLGMRMLEESLRRLGTDHVDLWQVHGVSFENDPDLFIRTGGERRISNFLLWNLAYTELYFSDRLWPEFDEVQFEAALAHFAARQRRFGLTTEQAAPNARR